MSEEPSSTSSSKSARAGLEALYRQLAAAQTMVAALSVALGVSKGAGQTGVAPGVGSKGELPLAKDLKDVWTEYKALSAVLSKALQDLPSDAAGTTSSDPLAASSTTMEAHSHSTPPINAQEQVQLERLLKERESLNGLLVQRRQALRQVLDQFRALDAHISTLLPDPAPSVDLQAELHKHKS